MARYALGDVQGCKASLDRLLARIDFSPARDRLWLVGDLVNRGPRSLDVLRWARELGDAVTCVLGNHDLHLLARAAGVVEAKKRDTLDDVLAAPDRDGLIDWLRRRPLVVADDTFVLVHAGLHPSWTVADARRYGAELEHELRGPDWRGFLGAQHGKSPRWAPTLAGADRWRALLAYFVRARMLRPDHRVEPDFDGPPAEAPAGLVPWFAVPEAAWTTHTAVFGHWSALGLDLGPHHIATDTGCVWGRSLTAVRLDDRQVFEVPAAESTAG